MLWLYIPLIAICIMMIYKVYYMTVLEKRRLEIEDSRNKDKGKDLNDTLIKKESRR